MGEGREKVSSSEMREVPAKYSAYLVEILALTNSLKYIWSKKGM